MQVSLVGSVGDGAGRSPVDAFVEKLARIRDEGFRRIWMTQLPWESDLLTVLAVALREVDTIEVGTGVLPIQVQHPMLLAQRALTVNLIAGGRLALGLGMSHRVVTEGMWGISWDKPVRRLGEYLDGLLPLLAGERADAAGETVTTRGVVRIPGAPAPEVYIAALGPQMLRLAGRRSAGTVTWMTGPKTLARHIGPTLATRRRRRADRRARYGWSPPCPSASPTMSTAHGPRPPNSSRCTDTCPPTGRCSTARASPARRTPRSSATRRRCRSGSTSCAPEASTSSPPFLSTSPQRFVLVRARYCGKANNLQQTNFWPMSAGGVICFAQAYVAIPVSLNLTAD